uniref:ATP synthase F0 subunit 6 n=1 Tax=Erianthus versicolor TaxID=470935 RepID=UPI0024118816|nr:ATP synthase F0 subunit 6 [Erianthus versicolor]WEL32785.1 ATP synthase F0 subunit 6 [Erianthus versicolor]
MMTNLFSTFDPSTQIMNISFNWMSSIIGLIIMPSMFWMMPNRMNITWNKTMKKINNEFEVIIKKNNNKSMTLMFMSMFTMILFNNFMGMFPYVFTSTSHMVMNLSLALPLWMCIMIYGWLMNTNHMFAHLVPQGTPNILMSFMVMIESVSNIIRPMTLAVRLTANMVAGHLLLTLMGNSGTKLELSMLMMMLSIQMMLIILEMAVAMIQAYVFSVLSTLYSSEVIYVNTKF